MNLHLYPLTNGLWIYLSSEFLQISVVHLDFYARLPLCSNSGNLEGYLGGSL